MFYRFTHQLTRQHNDDLHFLFFFFSLSLLISNPSNTRHGRTRRVEEEHNNNYIFFHCEDAYTELMNEQKEKEMNEVLFFPVLKVIVHVSNKLKIRNEAKKRICVFFFSVDNSMWKKYQ